MTASAANVQVRRIYDVPASADGARVLVDRLWPRGLSRQNARLDRWARDVAPSNELRRWYRHDPDRFQEFRGRYLDELASHDREAIVDDLAQVALHGPLTLLTATRDIAHSHAEVLAEIIRSRR